MKKLLAMLGFAARAGQAAIGAEMSVTLIRRGEAAAAALDEGASGNTQKRVKDACAYRGVPLIILEEGELGRAVGKPECAAVAVKKGELARTIAGILSQRQDQPIDS